jgi:hypothetical protein
MRQLQSRNTVQIHRDSDRHQRSDTHMDIWFKMAINNALDILCKPLGLRILVVKPLEDLVVCLHGVADLVLL